MAALLEAQEPGRARFTKSPRLMRARPALGLSAGLVCIGLWMNLIGLGVSLIPQEDAGAYLRHDSYFMLYGWLLATIALAAFPRVIERHRMLLLVVVTAVLLVHSQVLNLLLPAGSFFMVAASSFIAGLGYVSYVVLAYSALAQGFTLKRAIILITVIQVCEQVVTAPVELFASAAVEQVLYLLLPLLTLAGFTWALLPANKGRGKMGQGAVGNGRGTKGHQGRKREDKSEAPQTLHAQRVLSGLAARYLFLMIVCAYLASVAVSASSAAGVWGGLKSLAGEPETLQFVLVCAASLLTLLMSLLTLFLFASEPLSSRYQFAFLIIVAQFFLLIIGDYLFVGELPVYITVVNFATEYFGHLLTWTIIMHAIQSLRVAPYRIAALGLATYGLCSLGWLAVFTLAPASAKVVVLILSYLVVVVIAIHPRVINLAGKARATTVDELNKFTLSGELPVPLEVSGAAVATVVHKRCVLLAAKYGLTSREAEILFRMAQGRSKPQIQRQLVLSQGTVKTHITHIFEKTGTHSHQEVLNLVFDEE